MYKTFALVFQLYGLYSNLPSPSTYRKGPFSYEQLKFKYNCNKLTANKPTKLEHPGPFGEH